MVWQAYSANTRVFTYSACSTTDPDNAKPADCAAEPLLQAVVAFDDYPSGVASPSPTPSPCTPILQQEPAERSGEWLVWREHDADQLAVEPGCARRHLALPIVRLHQRGNHGHDQGTGFTSGETVNFTEQPQELATSSTYNPPVAATVAATTASCPAATCIQVTSPAITVGNAYFVTVTTPGGTSQTARNDYTSLRAHLHVQSRGADGHRARRGRPRIDHRQYAGHHPGHRILERPEQRVPRTGLLLPHRGHARLERMHRWCRVHDGGAWCHTPVS